FAVSISWMILCVTGAVFTALAGLAYFQQNGPQLLTDTTNGESVFLDLAQILFHPLIAGVLLAAVRAAIMSTISSQLIVSISALIAHLVAGFGGEHPAVAVLAPSDRVGGRRGHGRRRRRRLLVGHVRAGCGHRPVRRPAPVRDRARFRGLPGVGRRGQPDHPAAAPGGDGGVRRHG